MKRLTFAVVLCLTLCLELSPLTTSAAQRRSGYHVRYSGSHHTSSHGGHYAGGHYRNVRTGNRYGRHK